MVQEITLDPARFPVLAGPERPFFEFWSDNIARADDPHLDRWMAYENKAVETAEDRNRSLENWVDIADSDILEIGSQNGAWLVALAKAGANVVGIDVDEPAIEAAKIRGECWGVEVDARVGDACALAFPDESFDAVASSDVIEHVDDRVAMVREIMRVLKPGGFGWIQAPQRLSPKHLRADPHYKHRGVSILPARVAAWYLATFRNEPRYDVKTLPTGFELRRLIRRAGGVVRAPIDDNAPERGLKASIDRAFRSGVNELRQGCSIVLQKPPVM